MRAGLHSEVALEVVDVAIARRIARVHAAVLIETATATAAASIPVPGKIRFAVCCARRRIRWRGRDLHLFALGRRRRVTAAAECERASR